MAQPVALLTKDGSAVVGGGTKTRAEVIIIKRKSQDSNLRPKEDLNVEILRAPN
jgi:lipopolysaccharide export system protein LptA